MDGAVIQLQRTLVYLQQENKSESERTSVRVNVEVLSSFEQNKRMMERMSMRKDLERF